MDAPCRRADGSVGKYVRVGAKLKRNARGQERAAIVIQTGQVVPLQIGPQGIEEGQQVEHITCGVGELFRRQSGCPPVAGADTALAQSHSEAAGGKLLQAVGLVRRIRR